MKKIILVVLLFVLPYYTFSQQKTDFISPLDIPLFLSGNFGELRSDHFHTGIDIKTQGVTGQKVYAVDSGYVSRIKVQAGGYGKALYIDHPGGFTTVYGHLSEYNSDIGKFVSDQQYKRKSHSIDLYLKPGDLNVRKGDIIALSGNTGSSAGPHLHFEIRRSADQKPLNGLFYNFPIKDDINPKIKKLVIYPIGDEAQVNNANSSYLLDIVEDNNSFTIGNNHPIVAYGKIGFGIETYDYLNGSRNRCGIFSIELIIDGIRYFYSEMDGVSFAENRFINAHIDYSLKKEKNYSVQRLYKLPYNNISIYKFLENDGHIELRDTLLHSVIINTSDSYGNASQLAFSIKGTGATQQMTLKKQSEGILIPYNAQSGFSDRDIQITFPAYCFYEDFIFSYARTNGPKYLLSDVFHLHNEATPVHKSFNIELTPRNIPLENHDKICLVKVVEDEISYAGGILENGKINAQIRAFGKYAIAIDTIKPKIKPLNLHSGKDLTMQPGMRFMVEDNLSGISEYNGLIDDQWVLFEYDPKNSLLFYEFDNRVPISKKNHELEIHLSDGLGNKSVYHTVFYR